MYANGFYAEISASLFIIVGNNKLSNKDSFSQHSCVLL
jgi:hypothetical protein